MISGFFCVCGQLHIAYLKLYPELCSAPGFLTGFNYKRSAYMSTCRTKNVDTYLLSFRTLYRLSSVQLICFLVFFRVLKNSWILFYQAISAQKVAAGIVKLPSTNL